MRTVCIVGAGIGAAHLAGYAALPDAAMRAHWKRIGIGTPPITLLTGAAHGPANKAVPFWVTQSISTNLLPSLIGPVARVYADLTTRVNDIEVEDCAALSIRMGDGALVTSSVTLEAAGNSSRMRLMFEGFAVESGHAPYALADKRWTFRARAPTLQADVDAVLANVTSAPTGFKGMFTAMADALDGSPGREVTLEDGRRSLEFVTAAYASARSGLPVDLPLGPEHPLYGGWMP